MGCEAVFVFMSVSIADRLHNAVEPMFGRLKVGFAQVVYHRGLHSSVVALWFMLWWRGKEKKS